MSEKRVPDLVFTVSRRRKDGRLRSMKVELFRCSQWPNAEFVSPRGRIVRGERDRYRLRVAGKWFRYSRDGEETDDYLAVNKTEFRDLLWRSVSDAFRSSYAPRIKRAQPDQDCSE